MATENTTNNSINTVLIILLVLAAIILGFFLYRNNLGIQRSSIDVNLPNLQEGTNGQTP